MSAATQISLREYLETGFSPDRDYVEGEVLERNVGKKKHGYAQAEIALWFGRRKAELLLQPLTELRMQVCSDRVRVPDVVISQLPLPEEEVFTAPPYLCIEIMSPDDTISAMQDRLDDYLAFGIATIWVIDPWKHRGWRITGNGWALAHDGVMRTGDGRIAMPLADVLLS
jgi:Uma2 family endonuclease